MTVSGVRGSRVTAFITGAAKTRSIDDCKVFVSRIEDAVSTRAGEYGEIAL
jgi:nitrogen regulatory protein PII